MRTPLKCILSCTLLFASSLVSEVIWDEVTFHADSDKELFELYHENAERHPDSFSIVTGQSDESIAYEMILRAIYQKFKPAEFTEQELKKRLFYRHPSYKGFSSLDGLWKIYSHKDGNGNNHGYKYHKLSKTLICVSPSLDESHGRASAKAYYLNNYSCHNFYLKHLSKDLRTHGIHSEFVDEIENLFSFRPSCRRGILTQILIPKSKVINSYSYNSNYRFEKAADDNAYRLLSHYQYEAYRCQQLRILSSIFRKKGLIDQGKIKVFRYTQIPSGSLEAYQEKVTAVVDSIYKRQMKLNQQVDQMIQTSINQHEMESTISKLVDHYMEDDLPIPALKCLEHIPQHKLAQDIIALAFIQALINGEIEQAKDWLIKNLTIVEYAERLALSFVLTLPMLTDDYTFTKELLEHLPDSEYKNIAALFMVKRMKEPNYHSFVSSDFETNYKKLKTAVEIDLEDFFKKLTHNQELPEYRKKIIKKFHPSK